MAHIETAPELELTEHEKELVEENIRAPAAVIHDFLTCRRLQSRGWPGQARP